MLFGYKLVELSGTYYEVNVLRVAGLQNNPKRGYLEVIPTVLNGLTQWGLQPRGAFCAEVTATLKQRDSCVASICCGRGFPPLLTCVGGTVLVPVE